MPAWTLAIQASLVSGKYSTQCSRRQSSCRYGHHGGKLTFPGGGFYHATKHAVEALSDALRFEVKPFGVDVVVIEPGPIKTKFGDTAISAIHSVEQDGSPYAALNKKVADNIEDAYEGSMAKMAAGPEAVGRVIEKALNANKPRTRYPVTFAARMILVIRRCLPDRGFDAFLRSLYGWK